MTIAPSPEPPALVRSTAPVLVRIDELLPADSPRLDGEDEAHIQLLAESDAELPPILVHRATMRVIDGMHRLRAAALRGQDHIQVKFHEGPADEIFVLAVQTNISHGLPLSPRDRECAAARILAEHPHWSDRAIAQASGLSAKTIGVIRRRAEAGTPQAEPTARVGRDGRVRPTNNTVGRTKAAEFLAKNPAASLREIARAAGISPGTARDVRERLRRGEDPVPPGPHAPRSTMLRSVPTGNQVPSARGIERGRMILADLKKDPSLRFNESGRALLRLLDSRVTEAEAHRSLIDAAPVHTSYLLIEFAQWYAEGWRAVADRLRYRLDEVG
jgi:ParB-like chromosome segregation protein Spo0J